ncbi:hypothetical protein ACHAXT_002921 [Thalassiosira profunda]
MRRASVALASIKQNLTPKKAKPKKDGGRRRRRGGDEDSLSSAASSFDESSCSDLSESSYSSSYSESEDSREKYSRSRRDRGSRYHRSRGDRSRGDRRRYEDRGRRRGRRKDRYAPAPYGGAYAPHQPSTVADDEAAQMCDLLMRILPFYGQGDEPSDQVVVETIHRLPPHALEMQDVDGNTLLMLACQAGAFSLTPLLLSKGCNVNTRNNAGASPLHYACFVDTFNADAAISLVRHGALAEVVETEFGCTPLHWAAFSGHTELCAALCRAGGNPRTLDKNGCDAIHYAKQNSHTTCSRLLESYVDQSASASSPIAAGPATSPGNASKESAWVRCLDGSTGSSFYHNKETGESLWGEEFREADTAPEPPKPPEKAESKVDEGGERKAPGVVSDEAAGTAVSSSALPAVGAERKVEEERALPEATLAAIEEDVDERSSAKNGQPVPLRDASNPVQSEHKSQLDIDGIVETSSVDDEEPAQTEEGSSSGGPAAKKAALARMNSWDSDFYADERAKVVPLSIAPVVATPASGESQQDGCTDNDSGSAIHKETEQLLARNQSFEERISTLHLRMESQLISRLQHLEDKISQQTTVEASRTIDDGTSADLSEMASTILQLKTEVGTKDLELLSLKQKIVRLETDLVIKERSAVNAGVGDGDVTVDKLQVDQEKLLSEQTRHEQELEGARDEIAQLQRRVEEATKALDSANGQVEHAQRKLAMAEESARDEQASRSSMKALLEQAQQGGLESASLKEEKLRAEETILQLKEQLRANNNKAFEEREGHAKEVAQLKVDLEDAEDRLSQLEDEAQLATTKHEAALADLRDRHEEKSALSKRELERVRAELGDVQDRLRSARLEKMEAVVARDEAVDARERATEEAREAKAKLREMTDLIQSSKDLKESNDRLHVSLQDETEKRKVLHNTLEDMKGRIRVYVRVRPLSESELNANYETVLSKEPDGRTCVMVADPATATEVRDWEFDKIFIGSEADGNTQENIFKDTSLLITSAIDGFNVCIFAYGQTGSGKTYTMLGAGDGADDKHQGLAPRVAHELFQKLAERDSSHHAEVSVSMLELYTDKLRDLLASKNDIEGLGDLKIRLAEHTSSGLVEVDGAKIERVANAKELLEVFDRGTEGRASSSTKMNAESSRSHMIATIVLSLRHRRTGKMVHGKLTLVDLAGSERVSKSGATGHQLTEAQSINKSLSALGDVIGALTSGRQHIPYRNHPLTMLMSDSLGGNSKTLMFVCCSPADYNRKESANSLDFAKRCRNVKNNVTAGAKSSSANHVSQIRALRAELSKIKKKEGGGAKRRSNYRSPAGALR